MIGVLSLVFFLFSVNPADPARMLGGQFVSEELLADIRAKYGLDQPVFQQYLNYLERLSPISFDGGIGVKAPDLGLSYQSGRPVTDILLETIPNSLILAGTAIGIAMLLGIPFGILAALNKDTWLDRTLVAVSALGMAGPSFFVGMMVSWLFGFKYSSTMPLAWAPLLVLIIWFISARIQPKIFSKNLVKVVLGLLFVASFALPFINIPGTGLNMSGSWYEIDPFLGKTWSPKNLILPAITLGVRPLSVITQLTRNALLDVLATDYIRTARGKGLSQFRIMWKHALPPALNPVITAASGWFAGMLAGAVFVEYIFGWRGLGLALFEALQNEDQPLVMGAVLFFAVVFVVINIVVDMLYAWLDPRIRLKNI